MEYTQLDKTIRLNSLRNRIRDLENQHFQISLRIQAPDLTQPVNDMDQRNLDQLSSSLATLHQMETDLTSKDTPAPPIPATGQTTSDPQPEAGRVAP